MFGEVHHKDYDCTQIAYENILGYEIEVYRQTYRYEGEPDHIQYLAGNPLLNGGMKTYRSYKSAMKKFDGLVFGLKEVEAGKMKIVPSLH